MQHERGIYIEVKRAPFHKGLGSHEVGHDQHHAYLVYRDSKGGEWVIRGGPGAFPEGALFAVGGDIKVEIGALADTDDKLIPGTKHDPRYSVKLDIPEQDLEKTWAGMVEAAAALGSFAETAKDKRVATDPEKLGRAVSDNMAPLFGEKSEGAPSRLFAQTFQGAVNDTAAKAQGDTFQPIKEDGVIGPKTADAFGKAYGADDNGFMRTLSKSFGLFS